MKSPLILLKFHLISHPCVIFEGNACITLVLLDLINLGMKETLFSIHIIEKLTRKNNQFCEVLVFQ